MKADTVKRRVLNVFLIFSAGISGAYAASPGHAAGAGASWSDYGGSADAAQYSALKQIDRSNVSRLRVAWTYPTEDGARYLFNPLEAHGVLYVLAKRNSIVALDAATGKELWAHANAPGPITTRGINYWESADGKDRRLLFAAGDYLQAIDARTGAVIASFGDKGRVDLREGLGRDPKKITVQSLNPGRVFENLIIMGSATNSEYDSAPGDIRAYDVRTGALAWTFHTIPHAGEFGYDTWPPDAWKSVGGANDWAEMSLDTARGIVYIPTASPKYNFYGANRKGANLFGDCLLALDARTGKRLWHYQMVHHDIWDYDNATAPKLLTVKHDGRTVDVVAQAGKTGFLYVFNRVTGEPLWPIEERPVPRSDMPGEEAWPTQPFPTWPPPFARQKFTADDLNPYIADASERARWRDDIKGARNEGLFTPPGTRNTVEMPGNNGGANFGGAAIDPASGTMFIVSKDVPAMLKLRLTGPPGADPAHTDPAKLQYKTPFGFMITSSGLSAIDPPWTSLTAYDLNTGAIRWKIPLGEVPELAAKGITNTGAHFPKVGPVVTAGGLIFAGTRDRKVRALDAGTGKVLWSYQVDAGLEGMPAIYEMNGKEYVVFCAAATSSSHTHASSPESASETAGVHPADRNPVPGAYVAFALPDQEPRP